MGACICLRCNHFRSVLLTQIRCCLADTIFSLPAFFSCFAGKTESKDAFYFVGMFRITNVEFLPEYRQKESREFLSMAKTVQQVVRLRAWEQEGGACGSRQGSVGGLPTILAH